jgi:hypothetical protein
LKVELSYKNKKMNIAEVNKFIVRPTMAGALGYGLTWAMLGNEGVIPVIGGMSLSAPAALGCACFTGEIVGSLIADEALKSMDEGEEAVAMLIKPVITGVTVLGVTFIAIGNPGSMGAAAKVMGLGIASSVGSEYALDMLIPSPDFN